MIKNMIQTRKILQTKDFASVVCIFAAIAFIFSATSFVFGALPPDEWNRMRLSGYSSSSIDEFIDLDKSAAAGITKGGRNLDFEDSQLETISDVGLLSEIEIIGNGVWFTVIWKDPGSHPKRVMIIDPNRMILSEGEYKKTRHNKCYYRVPDSATRLASSVPLFAVAKMRLAELAYHPKFLTEQYKRIKQLGINGDPRIGRITSIIKTKNNDNSLFCKWSLVGFTAKPFETLSIFDKELNFIAAAVTDGKFNGSGEQKLNSLYGTILAPAKGDFVFPLTVAKELCVSQGRLLFQKPKKPLSLCNIYGTPTFSTDAKPLVSHSFPEYLFPGLYRFGVTRGTDQTIPCVQFTEVLIQKNITGMVDFLEMKEVTSKNKSDKDTKKYKKASSHNDKPIQLQIKRLAVRYYRK